MRISRNHLIVLVLIAAMALLAHAEIPPAPNPPRRVNDFAGVLHNVGVLEDSLAAFARNTGNGVVVVTVNDLDGLEPWDYAYQLGRKWGVGGSKHNNGVVVLLKPKTASSKGQVTIAPGYGLEGVLTDALCKRIIEKEMIPELKNNNYDGAVWNALRVILPVVAGEYNEKEYMVDSEDTSDMVIELIIYIIFFAFIIIKVREILGYGGGGGGGGGRRNGGSSGTGTWGGPIIIGGWGSGSSSSGGSSWGGGGGFSGFGGGSFGGGGASGSW